MSYRPKPRLHSTLGYKTPADAVAEPLQLLAFDPSGRVGSGRTGRRRTGPTPPKPTWKNRSSRRKAASAAPIPNGFRGRPGAESAGPGMRAARTDPQTRMAAAAQATGPQRRDGSRPVGTAAVGTSTSAQRQRCRARGPATPSPSHQPASPAQPRTQRGHRTSQGPGERCRPARHSTASRCDSVVGGRPPPRPRWRMPPEPEGTQAMTQRRWFEARAPSPGRPGPRTPPTPTRLGGQPNAPAPGC